MKAVCISNFHYYDIRMKDVMAFFTQRGYEVHYVTGDYDTMSRQPYVLDVPRTVQIPLVRYRKNISLERIWSHWRFARAVYKQLQRLQPDVIYAMVPPNFVAHYVALYKRKHPHVVIYYDVFDMWPESFPSTTQKKWLQPVFQQWQLLRDRALCRADGLVSECQLFLTYLEQQQLALPKRRGVVYPCQSVHPFELAYQQQPDTIGLCYLGSINNIIDIERIQQLLAAVSRLKRVVFHVIGDGEQRDALLQASDAVCHQVVYHGGLYDAQQKAAIFNQCAFGLNILKPTVFIGLTMKSLDYWNNGLPLINTVMGDTAHFIEQQCVGVQLTEQTIEAVAQWVSQLSTSEIMALKEQSRAFFQRQFDGAQHTQRLAEILDS